MSTERFSVGIFFPIQVHVEERGLEISGVGLWSVPSQGEVALWFENLWPIRKMATQREPRQPVALTGPGLSLPDACCNTGLCGLIHLLFIDLILIYQI